MPLPERMPVLQVEIGGVAHLFEIIHCPVRAVIIDLQFQIGIRREGVRPAANDVSAGDAHFARVRLREWEGRSEQSHGLVLGASIGVALQGEQILGRRLPIGAKSSSIHVPGVVGLCAGRQRRRIPIEVFYVAAVIGILTEFAPITSAAEPLLLCAVSAAQQAAEGFFGALGRDVDHAIDGVGAPERCARPANDLDAIDIFQ